MTKSPPAFLCRARSLARGANDSLRNVWRGCRMNHEPGARPFEKGRVQQPRFAPECQAGFAGPQRASLRTHRHDNEGIRPIRRMGDRGWPDFGGRLIRERKGQQHHRATTIVCRTRHRGRYPRPWRRPAPKGARTTGSAHRRRTSPLLRQQLP